MQKRGSADVADYSPEKFYTHATDAKGHLSQMRVAFPPQIANEISKYVASGKYPDYRTAQDVIRDAVFHRLKWLTDNGIFDCSDVLATWEVQMMIAAEQERLQLGQKILQDVNYLRMNAVTADDQLRLKELVNMALTSDLPEGVRLELLRIADRDI